MPRRSPRALVVLAALAAAGEARATPRISAGRVAGRAERAAFRQAAADPLAPAPGPPPPPAAPAPGPRRARSPWLTAELGAFGLRRELRFDRAAAGPAPLREHVARAILGPEARVEIRPGAPFSGGATARIGLFARYRRSAGLETAYEGAAARPTSLTRLSAGARWETRPLGSVRLTLAPALSYESLSVAVEPAIPGLPDARLSGVKGALHAEIPVGGAASVLLGGGYVRWTTARDLVAGEIPYFPGGTAFALEAEAGLSVALAGPVSATVAAEYGETRYALERDASGIYSADAATDRHVGARLTLRARL